MKTETALKHSVSQLTGWTIDNCKICRGRIELELRNPLDERIHVTLVPVVQSEVMDYPFENELAIHSYIRITSRESRRKK